MMTRRQALKTTALATAAAAIAPAVIAQTNSAAAPASEPFKLPPLPYPMDALEPHIDARTMEIHHDKHHAAYVGNLNKAWQQIPLFGEIANGSESSHLERLLKDVDYLSKIPAIRNNGGGHYNHSLFWQMMKKNGGGEPKAELAKAIDAVFGNFSDFKTRFNEAATKVFGSGWAWLVWKDGKLAIQSTPNQDTPLAQGARPLLGLDVWEHAYYLKYQNKRADYINAWWNVVNWDFVAERHSKLS
jgi:Fe-Mn family superoxide dismutase